MNLFLSPHNDDEALFGAFSIMRHKPLVVIVTDAARHAKRGLPIDVRRQESVRGCSILGAPVMFLGIPDDELTAEVLALRLVGLTADKVFAPAPLPNGNPDHNIVGEVAKAIFGKNGSYARKEQLFLYSTYTKDNLTPRGDVEIVPVAGEMALKEAALREYRSQIEMNKIHFDAVKGASEFYVND